MEASLDKKEVINAEKSFDYSKMNILFWGDTLSLPKNIQPLPKYILELENLLKFSLVITDSNNFVFVSDTTDFKQLLRYLPFLVENYQIYRCSPVLIEENNQINHYDGTLSEPNEATQQLTVLLETATGKKASDIHIECLTSGRQIRMRINGKLQRFQPESEFGENLIYKIKLISEMDIAISRTPQDGHFQYSNKRGEKFDLRTSTIPGIYGEKMVIRLLPAIPVIFSMDQLGFSNFFMTTVRKVLAKKSGMILFTGPTGSGKTTSLYAILSELISESLNIITIEDPVEYRMDSITQVSVNQVTGVTFSTALRSFLRQDPDVILVGEIRDSETAKMACRAAQTGHLVLSTLHCNDVFEIFQRFKGLDVAMDDLASSISLVVSQRLVNQRCICETADEICPKCNGSGILGRIPVLEILEIGSELRQLLMASSNLEKLKICAKQLGFQSLKENARILVEADMIEPSQMDILF
ncbi:MAG: type II/IV secretion system protein [Deltaproteobacteria bacterium]|jgi:general secretion pathway protein E|nr:type II/IV secretion system protein [Deltaproteobacteria bacterium]MBT4526130.1 type II/IV secretion system protein [Deltaproteobacteria bacterium]